MPATLPSPPSTSSPSTNASPDPTLTSRLDSLLADYLSLLDTYSTLRKQLSSDFSSGFLSLAHANRNATSTLGAGRRYGEEGFDGRMKATKGVRIRRTRLRLEADTQETDGEKTKAKSKEEEVTDLKNPKVEEDDEKSVTASRNEAIAKLKPLTSPNSANEETTADGDGDGYNEEIKTSHSFSFSPVLLQSPSSSTSTSTKPTDPLHWYGLFSPPPLRQCQTIFSACVSNTIPSLLDTVSHMRTLEDEIWAVRDELGTLDRYDYDHDHDHARRAKDSCVDLKNDDDAKEQAVKSAEKEASSSSTGSNKGFPGLVSRSRPAEPRSRVLKID